MGGGLAVGGGGLGLGVLVLYLVFTLLSSNDGLGQLAPLDDRSVGRGDTPSEVSQSCRTGEDANQRQDCRTVTTSAGIAKGPRARPCARSSRPIATPASGRQTRFRPD